MGAAPKIEQKSGKYEGQARNVDGFFARSAVTRIIFVLTG